eukprot:EG_transcript_2122
MSLPDDRQPFSRRFTTPVGDYRSSMPDLNANLKRRKSIADVQVRRRAGSVGEGPPPTIDLIWQRQHHDEADHFTYMATPDTDSHSNYHQEIEQDEQLPVRQDFKPVAKVHHFTRSERMKMRQFETIEYHEPINAVSKEYDRYAAAPNGAVRLVVLSVLALVVGFTVFVIRNSTTYLLELRTEIIAHHMRDNALRCGLYLILFSTGVTVLASLPVLFIAPAAAGSGLPEVMGYLNGVLLPRIFNIKTLLVKVFSVIMAVSSGMPVGPEGPIIHICAALGAGVSQGRSRTLGLNTIFGSIFAPLQSHRAQHDFITAGAAAGVATAFGAPIGGLLFVMEEICTWWDPSVAWRMFFGCMVSTYVAAVLNAYVEGWHWVPGATFPWVNPGRSILFRVDLIGGDNLLLWIPAVGVGVLTGCCSSVFSWVNLKRARQRGALRKWRQVLLLWEPAALCLMWTTLTFLLPFFFNCAPFYEGEAPRPDAGSTLVCPEPSVTYNPMAMLTNNVGEGLVTQLFSRGSRHLIPLHVLLVYFLLYSTFAAITAGCMISSGFVIPMLVMGALIGRMYGVVLCDIFDLVGWDTQIVDPGTMAMLGAAGFFAGVCRLTISLTVIMLEMTNDLPHLLPIMCSVMVAKAVADYFVHPLYHALLQVKCIPFLNAQPGVQKLACFTAADVMAAPVVTVCLQETVGTLIRRLKDTSHNCFPVVHPETEHFVGTISRHMIELVLSQPVQVLEQSDVLSPPETAPPPLKWESVMTMKERKFLGSTRAPVVPEHVHSVTLDLSSYVHTSPYTVREDFALSETYALVRGSRLRHLVVLDGDLVSGIITRKDLLGQNLEASVLRVSGFERGPSSSYCTFEPEE